MKKIIAKYILLLATQLSQNQNKLFSGKVIAYTLIPEVLFCLQCSKIFHNLKHKHIVNKSKIGF